MKKLLFIIFITFFSINNAFSISLNVYVDRVIDGDTFVGTILKIDLPIRVRLAKIDTFESKKNKHLIKQEKWTHKSQKEILSLGLKSKEYLKDLIENKIVCVIIDKEHPTGAYGRYIGYVYDEPCGISGLTKSVNTILLEKQLAIPYRK